MALTATCAWRENERFDRGSEIILGECKACSHLQTLQCLHTSIERNVTAGVMIFSSH